MTQLKTGIVVLADALVLLFASDAFGAQGDIDRLVDSHLQDERLLLRPGHEKKVKTPAVIVDRSRDPALTRDYLRLSFLADPNLVPTTVARPDALRAFFTVSRLFEPPIPMQEVASYLGLPVEEQQNLAVYDCRPPDPNVAVLATWPNVMNLLQDDLGSKYSCPPQTPSPENEVFCIAAAYFDSPEPSVTRTLEHTYLIAGELFDPAFPARAEVLRKDYGIFPAFSGLGYAVRGSETGGPFTAQKSLRNSIVSEYLLPNRTFAEMDCACIIVAPYPGRSQDPLDPLFVAERGSPECTRVDRLRPAADSHLLEAGGIEDWLSPWTSDADPTAGAERR